jgi:hypothetical protein
LINPRLFERLQPFPNDPFLFLKEEQAVPPPIRSKGFVKGWLASNLFPIDIVSVKRIPKMEDVSLILVFSENPSPVSTLSQSKKNIIVLLFPWA